MYDLLRPLLEALGVSDVARLSGSVIGLTQTAEALHMLFFSIVIGCLVVFALRLLGLSPTIPVATFARHLIPAIWISLVVLAVTGAIMFAPRATRIPRDQLFQVKMALLAVALVSLVYLQARIRRRADVWDADGAPLHVKAIAALCLLVSPVIVVAARMMYAV